MNGNAVLRWARALSFASVMLGTGVAGHVVAGGDPPGAPVLGALFLVTSLAVAPWLDTPASTGRVVALLGLGEGATHLLLHLLGGGGAAVLAGGLATHPMAHGTAPLPAGSSMTGMSGLTDLHLGMLLAHVVAAVTLGLWLAAGERAAWTLLALVALPVVDAWIRLRELARTGTAYTRVVARPRPLRRWPLEVEACSTLWAGRGVSRRGPPRLSAA